MYCDMIHSVINLSADKMNSIYTNYFTSSREHSIIGAVPSATFRENHELYYDGAEGPDKIGHYNVRYYLGVAPLELLF